MGSSCSNSSTEQNSKKRTNQNNNQIAKTGEQTKVDPNKKVTSNQTPIAKDNFQDFKTYDDIIVGEGAKRMKGYECRLAVDELQNLREEFWKSKTSGHNKRIWKVIQSCCETDGLSATMLLTEVGLKCIGDLDSMNDLMYEANGEIFHVPNFVINDPVFKKDFIEKPGEKEQMLEIVLFNCYDQKKDLIQISNMKYGKDLKLLYLKLNKLEPSLEKYKIRMMNKGFEIKDDQKLSTHTINKDSSVQVIMKEIIPGEDN